MTTTNDKRRRMIETALRTTTQAAADDGHLIEFNWRLFARLVLPPSMPAAEVSERRLAFLAGAESLYTFMLTAMVLTEDTPAAVTNWERLTDKLSAECDGIQDELRLRFGDPAGNA